MLVNNVDKTPNPMTLSPQGKGSGLLLNYDLHSFRMCSKLGSIHTLYGGDTIRKGSALSHVQWVFKYPGSFAEVAEEEIH